MEKLDPQMIGVRVEDVRKHIKMTRDEFCSKIGISPSALYNIEKAKLKVLPDNTLRLICATFGVDYFWLTTGEGEMLYQPENPVADKIDDLLEGENETAKAVFRAFANFSEEDWKTVQKFIDRLKEAK